MERIGGYARRGCRLRNESSEALVERWVEVVREWCDEPTNVNLTEETEDIEAELSLRGVPVPEDRVADAVGRLGHSLKRSYEENLTADPEHSEKMADAFRNELLRFARSVDEAVEH
jgi:transposase